jgi:hypothetical protein
MTRYYNDISSLRLDLQLWVGGGWGENPTWIQNMKFDVFIQLNVFHNVANITNAVSVYSKLFPLYSENFPVSS